MQDNRKALAVLFISLFLVMVGFGIIMPILPFYVRYYQGNAATLGFLMSTYSVMQFMFAPFWGRLSDRIGRRPVLLIGLSGYGASFIVFGFANHLWMLFAARIIAGIVSSATLPTAMAYVADITASEKLAKGMGLMGAAMSLGIILGRAWAVHSVTMACRCLFLQPALSHFSPCRLPIIFFRNHGSTPGPLRRKPRGRHICPFSAIASSLFLPLPWPQASACPCLKAPLPCFQQTG